MGNIQKYLTNEVLQENHDYNVRTVTENRTSQMRHEMVRKANGKSTSIDAGAMSVMSG